MKIKAAVVQQKKVPLSLLELEMDEPRANEVLIKVIATGICRTDLDVRDGYLPTPMPVVTGHEGAGVVEKVGSHVKSVSIGDHVVLSLGSCGQCEFCKQSLPSFCIHHMDLNFAGARQDGSVCLHNNAEPIHSHFFSQSSHANYAIVDESSLVKVDKTSDLGLLGPLACGVMTGAGGVLNTLKPTKGSSIAIFGAGTVGLSALMAAKIAHCAQIIVIDNKTSRLELAKELGATHTVLSEKNTDVIGAIKSITEGKGVQFAFESSGVKSVISNALSSVRELGTLVITGVLPQGEKVEFDAWDLLRGRRVIGSVMGDTTPAEFIPKMVGYYKKGVFPIDKLITKYDFENINQAIEDGISGKIVKAVVVMSHD